MRKEVTHFDETSAAYQNEYERLTTEGYSFRVRRYKLLREVPEVQSGAKALDVGCGPGVMVEGLRAKGYHVSCVDAAPAMIKLAKKKYGELSGTEFMVGDVYSLPFPDATFNTVIAIGLIEYLEKQDAAIAELARVMRKDALLLISFPNKWSPWRVFNRLALAILNPLRKKDSSKLTHREYTQREVRGLLAKGGFEVIKTHFYNFKLIPYPLDKKFPKLTVWQSQLFEILDRTPLKWLGTGFIVVAKKRSDS